MKIVHIQIAIAVPDEIEDPQAFADDFLDQGFDDPDLDCSIYNYQVRNHEIITVDYPDPEPTEDSKAEALIFDNWDNKASEAMQQVLNGNQ